VIDLVIPFACGHGRSPPIGQRRRLKLLPWAAVVHRSTYGQAADAAVSKPQILGVALLGNGAVGESSCNLARWSVGAGKASAINRRWKSRATRVWPQVDDFLQALMRRMPPENPLGSAPPTQSKL